MISMKAKYKNLSVYGFKWTGFDRGIHSFEKPIGKTWACIQCTTEQIENGDLEFMIKHEVTLMAEVITKIQRKWKPQQ